MKTHYTLNGTGELLLPQNQLPARIKPNPSTEKHKKFLTFLACLMGTMAYSYMQSHKAPVTETSYQQQPLALEERLIHLRNDIHAVLTLSGRSE